MIHDLHQLKMILAALIGSGAFLADVVTETKGWEDEGLKAILIAAVIWLVRESKEDRAQHKAELKEAWDSYKAESAQREDTLKKALDAQTASVNELVEQTKKQTDHLALYARHALESKIPKPELP